MAHAPNFDASTRPNLAVIASGTEKVFADVGLTADLIAEIASSVGLLASFEHVELDGRVLIAQAKNGRTELLEGLTARGIDVESIAAYQNVMPELDPEAIESAREADVVVFASPSAVERYVGHVGVTPTAAVCIGDVTAETARKLAFSVTTATAPTVDAILAALAT